MGTLLNARLAIAVIALAALVGATTPLGRADVAEAGGPATLIACLHSGRFIYHSRPENCDFFARQYSPSGRLKRFRSVTVHRVRWAGWGSPEAIGIGRSEVAEPMRIRVFDRVRCPDGHWYYGKVVTHAKYQQVKHLKLAVCGASRFPPFHG
jgi:hypothetical protein